MAVVFISAELEEVLRLSHRIAVMRDRRKVAEIANADDVTVRRRRRAHRERRPAVSPTSTVPELRPAPSPRHRAVLAGRRAGRAAAGQRAAVNPASSTSPSGTGTCTASSIDILRNSAPLLLVALGMTLVIATRGIDLSVGAVVAIAGRGRAARTSPASADPAALGHGR